MNTYREVVSIVQDLLKNVSDDKLYNENHIMYIFNKHRSLILYKYYKNKDKIPESVAQTICIDMERLPDCATGMRVVSKAAIPEVMDIGEPRIFMPDNPYNYRLTFVPFERFPFVNSTDILKNIIYATKGVDQKIHINASRNINSKYIKQLRMRAVFEDPAKANELACDPTQDENPCDPLDGSVGVDDKLMIIIIKSVLQELAPSMYKPVDNQNNAKDDLSNSSIDAYLRSIRNQRQQQLPDYED